jgi:hypothetical protein
MNWLDTADGIRLTQDAYLEDVDARLHGADGFPSWKLERRQAYWEEGFPSWDAFMAGDWERSLALYDELRPGLLELGRTAARHRSPFCRVRVVEPPLSAYLLWELHVLRVRAECCKSIRVVDAAALAPPEAGGPLPDALSLCGQVMYHTRYTRDGVPDGAVRLTGPAAVRSYETVVRALHASGEDIERYVRREVLPLGPPKSAG